ncbi:MAG: hypothetical protein K1000chlam2_00224 [Chlamydiae bacterium]|nr:hypothetical protein [Chlamydiota bacterium]
MSKIDQCLSHVPTRQELNPRPFDSSESGWGVARPNGYSVRNNGEFDVYYEYWFLEKDPNFLHKERTWVPLSKIRSGDGAVPLPFGTYTLRNMDLAGDFRREGYYPIFTGSFFYGSFFAAYMEFLYACELIFEKAIKNQNVVTKSNRFMNSKGFCIENNVVYRSHLSVTQRVALVAFGVGMIFRASVYCCQLGFIFYPFDRAFDLYLSKTSAPLKKSDFPLLELKKA